MGNTQEPGTRKVAIYGRVSTEHEAQLAAFENQQAWYESVAHQHPEWRIVERYYDEGITGTAAKKRPAFMQMIDNANDGKFDLIVTREVYRFARNTVDTLTVTRELKRIGVEVYFVQDNIWTMDGDGELRLTIMATLAQEESRKISERVLAGQQISREKGVLYGTGNILGYDRVRGTYAVNPEQAYTVQKIFTLYAAGWGYRRICAELIRLGCKNAHGEVVWTVDRIGRILRNATYKGYIGYNKSHSDGYLTQKRINHPDDEFTYVKGDFSPIVSEELWDRCAELRAKKSARQRGPDGKLKKFGRKEPRSVWCDKLRCSCGSSFRRFLWHRNADGSKTYGYECYRQKRDVSRKYLEAHGLDTENICCTKSIPSWHIDLMALHVFKAVWKDQKEAVLLACQMLQECAVQDCQETSSVLNALQKQRDRLVKKQEGLREMRALGDISREEFLCDNHRLQKELETIQLRLEDLNAATTAPGAGLDLEAIRNTLNRWVDFSGTRISDELIEELILQVVVVDDNTFNWTLDLSLEQSDKNCRLSPSEIALRLYQEKQGRIDPALDRYTTAPQPILTFTITGEEAKAYCRAIGLKFFRKKWKDKTVIVSI